MLGNLDRAFNGRPEYAPPPEVLEAQERHRLGKPSGQGHGRPRAVIVRLDPYLKLGLIFDGAEFGHVALTSPKVKFKS